MNNHDFVEKFTQVLQPVYEQMRDFGDAPSFQKGIVRGMMMAAKSFGVSTEVLVAIVTEARTKVFDSPERPHSAANRRAEMNYWLGAVEDLDPEELEQHLDTPTFMRDPLKK